ncbi:MAG: hypothetical protein SFY32_11180 [Bacteroidota bacterium]|nr:hypothetical protein [Bacteroidota bacterium]
MKYENLLIGDFIYSLGYASCEMKVKNNKVDLLQQTPADTTVGDLIGRIGGVNFIMEFKRNRQLLKSETKKPFKDFLLKDNLSSELLVVSSKSHFIAFWENMELLVNPYLYLNPKYSPNFPEPFSQDVFFKMLLEQKVGVDKDEIKTYLTFLAKNTKPSNTTSSSSVLVNYLEGRKPLIIDMSGGFSLDKKMEISEEAKIVPQKSKGMGFGFEM